MRDTEKAGVSAVSILSHLPALLQGAILLLVTPAVEMTPGELGPLMSNPECGYFGKHAGLLYKK